MADFESPPPNPNLLIKFPTHLEPSWVAFSSLREPFAQFLSEMCNKLRKVVVIHNAFSSHVIKAAFDSISNVETYWFNSVSAFNHALFTFDNQGKSFPITTPKELPSTEDCTRAGVPKLGALLWEPSKHASGELFNTVRSLEAPFLDVLAREDVSEGRKMWAIGPILLKKPSSSGQESAQSRHECLEWLDKHEPDSVIYVSFGTTTTLSDEEVRELALGLEQSEVKFLWMLRDADRGNVFGGDARRIDLPQGFEDRTRGVGLIVRDWAPQVDILAHLSTGGFVSHCGWNSILESLTMGVPLATWPMHSDQPRNAYLVIEILKAGIVARDWTQRRELMKASAIAEVVRSLMASEVGGNCETSN